MFQPSCELLSMTVSSVSSFTSSAVSVTAFSCISNDWQIQGGNFQSCKILYRLSSRSSNVIQQSIHCHLPPFRGLLVTGRPFRCDRSFPSRPDAAVVRNTVFLVVSKRVGIHFWGTQLQTRNPYVFNLSFITKTSQSKFQSFCFPTKTDKISPRKYLTVPQTTPGCRPKLKSQDTSDYEVSRH